jgi:hypothetical protein
MRTYIFTSKERKVIRSFLEGSLPRSDPYLMVILSRVRGSKELPADIELFGRLAKTMSTATA